MKLSSLYNNNIMHNTHVPSAPFLFVQRYGINSACGRENFGVGTGYDGPVGGVNRLIRVSCVGPTRSTTGNRSFT